MTFNHADSDAAFIEDDIGVGVENEWANSSSESDDDNSYRPNKRIKKNNNLPVSPKHNQLPKQQKQRQPDQPTNSLSPTASTPQYSSNIIYYQPKTVPQHVSKDCTLLF